MPAKVNKGGAPISIASFNATEHYFYRRWLWIQVRACDHVTAATVTAVT